MTANEVVTFPDRRAVEAEAAEWLIRLDRDSAPTPAERAELRAWLKRSPVHRDTLKELAQLWGNMNVLTELAVPLGASPQRASWAPRLAAVAASIVLIVAAGFFARGIWMPDPLLESNGLYATAVGQQQETLLADGSVVFLNTDSQIRVEYGDAYRDVRLLRGEAHFTVAEDESLPFRVFAGDSRVQAVGTAFAVHITEDGVDVTVTDGEVTIATLARTARSELLTAPVQSGNTGEIGQFMEPLGILSAGQRAIVARPSPELPSGEPEALLLPVEASGDVATLDRHLLWREGVLSFTGEPLQQVIDEFSRYTTIDIRIDDPELRAVPVGGRFPIGETDAMLSILESNFNLRVIRLGPEQVLLAVND